MLNQLPIGFLCCIGAAVIFCLCGSAELSFVALFLAFLMGDN